MKSSLLNNKPLSTDLAALLLRLTFGCLFIYHGYQKLSHYDEILPMFGDIIGIGSALSFNLVIFAEFFCGIFVALGFVTRLSVIPIFITMTVAYFKAHAAAPFQQKELPFLFWLLCFVVFILGSGRFSVDGLIFKKSV